MVVQLKSRISRWTKVESQCQPILAVAIHIRIEIYQTVTSDSREHRAWQCRNQPLQEMNVALQGEPLLLYRLEAEQLFRHIN